MTLRDRVSEHWRERQGSGGLLDAALVPVELLFRSGAALFHAGYDSGLRQQTNVGVPVISVGNLTVGGTGKTPFSRWLVDLLCDRGHHPALLHGGYADDEPALHREWHPDVPVYAARDRVGSAQNAVARGADVLVLDDGYQHRRLARSLDIALVSADAWGARRALLPRGPWREPLSALRRADAVVVMRKTASRERADETSAELRPYMRPGALMAGARLESGGWRGAGEGGDVPQEGVAVSAIADPVAFEAQAAHTGVRVAEAVRFPDHHAYSAGDADMIRRRAAGRAILCTAKDWVKLRDLIEPDDVWVLEQRLYFDFGVDALMAGIERVMQ